jgi:hypothetical protein
MKQMKHGDGPNVSPGMALLTENPSRPQPFLPGSGNISNANRPLTETRKVGGLSEMNIDKI